MVYANRVFISPKWCTPGPSFGVQADTRAKFPEMVYVVTEGAVAATHRSTALNAYADSSKFGKAERCTTISVIASGHTASLYILKGESEET